MSHDLAKYEEMYFIQRFDDEPIQITKTEFDGLSRMLSEPNVKFVQMKDRIINVNSIKEVVRQAKKPNIEVYAETGSNPYFREWCSLPKPKPEIKKWLQNNL